MVKDMYQKALDWWLNLKWWWKILAVVPLVGILLLGALSLFTPSSPPRLSPVENAVLEELKVYEAQQRVEINAKQREIATKLGEADSTNTIAAERLRTLMEAQSMDELDALRRKWDL